MLDTVAVGSTGVMQIYHNKMYARQNCLAHRCRYFGYSRCMSSSPGGTKGETDELEGCVGWPCGTAWRTERASQGVGTPTACCCCGMYDTAQSACILNENNSNGILNEDNNKIANGHGGGLNDQQTGQPQQYNLASIHDIAYTRSSCVCFGCGPLHAGCWLLYRSACFWLQSFSLGRLFVSAGCCTLAARC